VREARGSNEYFPLMKYLLILIICYACISQKKNRKGIQEPDLIGTWCLTTKQINYPSISFKKDSIAIFTSLGDTIYSFKYYMNNKNLYLVNDNRLTENKILKLTRDSLVFENLVEHNIRQIYYRCDGK
jgi:hypothetical protein